MKKKLIMAAMSLLAGVGIASAGVAPAFAAYTDCPSGVFCTWDGTGATSTRWQFPYSLYGPTWLCWDLGSGQGNNNWESYQNGYGSNYYVNGWNDFHCDNGGSAVELLPNGHHGNLPNTRNVVSSFEIRF